MSNQKFYQEHFKFVLLFRHALKMYFNVWLLKTLVIITSFLTLLSYFDITLQS